MLTPQYVIFQLIVGVSKQLQSTMDGFDGLDPNLSSVSDEGGVEEVEASDININPQRQTHVQMGSSPT